MNQKEELDELYLKALKVQETGDFVEALRLFRQGAALGDAGAQNAVGNAYCAGEGVEKDEKKGIEWYKKAYRTDKQVGYLANIAVTYAHMGKRTQAIRWWRKAVAQGDGEAALGLAKFLMISDQVLNLLRMAAACEESWQISPAGKEEAEVLLHFLTRKTYD